MLAELLNVIFLGYRTKLLLIGVFLKMYMKVMMMIVNSTYKLLSNYYVSRSRSNALQTSYFSQKKTLKGFGHILKLKMMKFRMVR